MGAEAAAPAPRGRSRGRAPTAGHRGVQSGAPEGAGPLPGNRGRQRLLDHLGPIMRECTGGCNQPQIDLAAIPGVMRCACGCGGSCEENMSVARCACGCGGTCEDSVARAAAPGGGSPTSSALGGVSSVVGRSGRGLDGRTRSRMERELRA